MARRGVRVVAGEAGGRRLVVPPRARPTTDRVRESLFGVLGPDAVRDAVVLDLYAGSGALAIEALSRGASRAVLVDRDRGAALACRQNLATTRYEDRARVHQRAVRAFLGAGPPAEAPFDLVCADPPYDATDSDVAALLEALAGPGWLAPDAVVVVERASSSEQPPAPAGWGIASTRTYGDTLVVIWRVPSASPEQR
jgi:16S rRNA (guanine966-N2)-methyltransferase